MRYPRFTKQFLLGFTIIILMSLQTVFPLGHAFSPTVDSATVSVQATSLTMAAGSGVYIFGFATGGCCPTGDFQSGQYAAVNDIDGFRIAGLAVTSSNTNSYPSQTAFNTIGGVAVSGYASYTSSFQTTTASGPNLSVSDSFTVTAANSLVVVVAIGGGAQCQQLSGIPNLTIDADTTNLNPIVTIAHSNLGTGTYTATTNTQQCAAGQDPNHAGDLIGAFVFSPAGTPGGSSPTWTNITPTPPAPSPPTRWGTGFAYDPLDRYSLLFAGDGGGGCASDTWTYANGVWAQLSPSSSPSTRCADTSMAYDPIDGYVLLFGGTFNGVTFGDTWSFVGGTWTDLTPTLSTSPPARWAASLAYDPVDNYMLLFGGVDSSNRNLNDAWAFKGGAWTQITTTSAPSPRSFAGLVYDPTDNGMVTFGGASDTWKFVGGAWTQLSPTTTPPSRWAPGLVWDSADGYVLMFGGWHDVSTTLQDTWKFSGNSWTQLSPSTSPSSRGGPVMVFDGTDGYPLLFGGQPAGCCTLSDTWKFSTSGQVLSITTGALPTAEAGNSYTAALMAVGGSPAYAWTSPDSSLLQVNGLSFSSTGVLSGTPTTITTISFRVQVQDSIGATATVMLNLNVIQAPFIDCTPGYNSQGACPLPTATPGTAYSQGLTPHGGFGPPFTFSQSGNCCIPMGLSLNSDGTISGVPTSPGDYKFSIKLSDSKGNFSIIKLEIVVPPIILAVTPDIGPTLGGTDTLIAGTGFTGATSVSFGSNSVNCGFLGSCTVKSDTLIEISSVPANGQSGTVFVTVTTNGYTSPTDSTSCSSSAQAGQPACDQFEYVTPSCQSGAGFAISPPCSNLVYQGGDVMHNAQNYLIFWLPGINPQTGQPYTNPQSFLAYTYHAGAPDSTYDSTYEALIQRYFSDVCSSTFYGLLNQYPGTGATLQGGQSAPTGSCSFGASWVDNKAIPSGKGTSTNPLTDQDIRDEIESARSARSWSIGKDVNEFYVFMPNAVYVSPPGGFACGYHNSYSPLFSAPVIYAVVLDPSTLGCTSSPTPNTYPNGDANADNAVSITAHEQFESVTDPYGLCSNVAGIVTCLGGGWFYQDTHHEIGDECNFYFPSYQEPVVLNGDSYLVQAMWDNRNVGCDFGTQLPNSSTTTAVVGGAASANQISSTGVSLTVSASSAITGTPVTINSTILNGQPAFTGLLNIQGVLFYDVKVIGVSDGTATLCVTNLFLPSMLLPSPVMEYWNGLTWIIAANVVFLRSSFSLCGQIPVASLTGTPIVIGNPPRILVSEFFTNGSGALLPLDSNGNPMVNVILSNGKVKSTNPGQVSAWVNATNTGPVPLHSLELNETIPTDWTIHPSWLPAKGALSVFFEFSNGSLVDITSATTIITTTLNPETISLSISNITASIVGKPLGPGESILLSAKLGYSLVGTSQTFNSYPRNYTDTTSASAWTLPSFSGGQTSASGSAFFMAYAKVNGDVNGDGVVDIIDAGMMAYAYGSRPGDARWNPALDVLNQGEINLLDVSYVYLNYGNHA